MGNGKTQIPRHQYSLRLGSSTTAISRTQSCSSPPTQATIIVPRTDSLCVRSGTSSSGVSQHDHFPTPKTDLLLYPGWLKDLRRQSLDPKDTSQGYGRVRCPTPCCGAAILLYITRILNRVTGDHLTWDHHGHGSLSNKDLSNTTICIVHIPLIPSSRAHPRPEEWRAYHWIFFRTCVSRVETIQFTLADPKAPYGKVSDATLYIRGPAYTVRWQYLRYNTRTQPSVVSSLRGYDKSKSKSEDYVSQ
jgi:hypothetical protein